MTGHIKTGGSWKTASKLAVKVAGTWKTASVGYIKVAGTWKQWFAALISDTFTRTTSGSLGTTDSGISWSTLRGTWFSNGSQAQSNDAGSTYALASVPLGSADATVSASTSGGVGVAFWVSDANSWWAAVPYYNQTSYSATDPCCSVGYGCSGCAQQSQSGSCTTSCNTVWDKTCSSTSLGYYTCPNGGELSACNGATQVITCHVKTYSCTSGYVSGTGCYLNGYPPSSYYYIGPATCASTTYQGTLARDCSSCPSATLGGGGNSTTGCYTSREVCTSTQNACPSGWSANNNCSSPMCYYTPPSSVNNVCQCGTYSYCNSCSYTAYSQYYYIRLLSSVNGTVSSPVGDQSVGQAVGSIKVTTSGSNVSAQAYSGSDLTGAIGSGLTHTTGATRGTSHGIIKITSDYNQGSTADNFSAGI